MMSRNYKLASALAAAVAITCGATAQDAMIDVKPAKNESFMRSSQLIGTEIRNLQNEPVGRIEDVVINERGKVAFVVVGAAGADTNQLGAIPWAALRHEGDGRALTVDLTKERLASAPMFTRDAWPDFKDTEWHAKVKTFYGVPAATMEKNAAVDASRDRTLPAERDPMTRHLNTDRNTTTPATATITGTVKSVERGDPVAIMVTTPKGDVHAMLATPAIVDRERLSLRTGATVTLKGYESTKDGQRHLSVTEYTADGRTVRFEQTAPASMNDRGDVVRERTTSDSNLRDVSGTVSYVESGQCESAHGRLAYVRTQDGERIVALGPGTYLDQQRWHLRPNDQISVRGYDYDRDGRRYFMATEVRRGQDTWTIRQNDGTPAWR